MCTISYDDSMYTEEREIDFFLFDCLNSTDLTWPQTQMCRSLHDHNAQSFYLKIVNKHSIEKKKKIHLIFINENGKYLPNLCTSFELFLYLLRMKEIEDNQMRKLWCSILDKNKISFFWEIKSAVYAWIYESIWCGWKNSHIEYPAGIF